MWGHSENVAVCKPRREPSQGTTQPAPWSWTSQPPELREINFCCLSLPFYGILLWQPKLTNTRHSNTLAQRQCTLAPCPELFSRGPPDCKGKGKYRGGGGLLGKHECLCHSHHFWSAKIPFLSSSYPLNPSLKETNWKAIHPALDSSSRSRICRWYATVSTSVPDVTSLDSKRMI